MGAKVKFLAAEALRGVGGILLDADGNRFCNELAKEYKFDIKNVEAAFKEYNENAEKQAKDPNGGPYEAYGGGKAWDKWGKKFYHNLPMDVNDQYHVAIVTPVIHYCMGGIKMNDGAECADKNDKVIPGLFVAGEAMGGVHGKNRLGGNS